MIGVVMSSWGRELIAMRCLKSLLKTEADMRIVVIDHEPEHKLAKLLLPIKPIHCVVAFDRNMGKGYGQNLGRAILREACEYHELTEPDYYLFLDDDVVFREGWLDIGMTLMKKYHEDYHMLSFYRGGSDHNHMTCEIADGDAQRYRFGVVNSSQGICWLIPKKTAKEIGDIMTWRPISGIDTDLIKKLGTVHLAIDGLVRHMGFGHSTHRGELHSWDKQKAWDDKIEAQYGHIDG